MFIQKQIDMIIVLFALTSFPGILPAPIADFDIPDVYSAVLPKYDFNIIKKEESSDESTHKSLELVKNQTDKKNDTEVGESGMDETVMAAFVELDALQKLLEVDTQYIEKRKREDSTWPNTLITKLNSQKLASNEENLLEEDLQRAVSVIVVMRLMEERLSLVNKYVEKTIAAHPDKDINMLFGNSKNFSVIQGLFEFKYFEGVLHSANTMLDQILTEDGLYSPFSTSAVIPGGTVQPFSPIVDDDDFTIGTFIILLFTIIGFFFVLFLIVFLLLKAVRMCFENNPSFDKKSRYEKI